MLEAMLKDEGKDIPPAHHPPKTRAEAPIPQTNADSGSNQHQNRGMPSDQSTTPKSMHDGSTDGDSGYQNDIMVGPNETHPPARIQSSKKEGLVHMLLSTRGHLSFDQLSGRLRFFGPASTFIFTPTIICQWSFASLQNKSEEPSESFVLSVSMRMTT